jgi:hypothetical protein
MTHHCGRTWSDGPTPARVRAAPCERLGLSSNEMSPNVRESQSLIRFLLCKYRLVCQTSWHRPSLRAPRLELHHVDSLAARVLRCNIIEAPWLVNGGHGASLRHHIQLIVTPAITKKRTRRPQRLCDEKLTRDNLDRSHLPRGV